ncbi:MAG: hypothetical protein AAF658_08830, partial [Myxococcota bacterium]
MRTFPAALLFICAFSLLTTSSTARGAEPDDQRLLRWLIGDLDAEARASTLRRLSRDADTNTWRSARAIALDVTPPQERVVILPVLVERLDEAEDVEWLYEMLGALPDAERRRWLKDPGPVRGAYIRELRRVMLTGSAPDVRRALDQAAKMELHRTLFADLVAEGAARAERPDTQQLLFAYLVRWQPKRMREYLAKLAATEGEIGREARKRLAAIKEAETKERAERERLAWLPDVITRGRAPIAPVVAGEHTEAAGTKDSPSAPAIAGSSPLATRSDSPRSAERAQAFGVDSTEQETLEPAPDEPRLADALKLSPEFSTASGRWPLVVYSTAAGALSFGTIGDIAFDETTGIAASAVIGGVIGGAIPYLLTLDREVTLGDTAYIGSHATWAAAAGAQSARLLDLDERLRQPRAESAVAILTGFSAMVASALTFDEMDWTVGDAARVNAVGLQAGLVSQSLLALTSESDPFSANEFSSRFAASTVLAYSLGFLPASFWARELELDREDREFVAFGATLGALSGAGFALSSRANIGSEQKLALGALGGQALGYVGSLALTPAVDE